MSEGIGENSCLYEHTWMLYTHGLADTQVPKFCPPRGPAMTPQEQQAHPAPITRLLMVFASKRRQ